MNIPEPHLICLIEEDSDLRDMLTTALSGEGYLTSGFRSFTEAMSFLYKSNSPLSLLLANNSYSFHEWMVFQSELNQITGMKETRLHTYKTPLDLSRLINEVSNLLKN